MRAMVGAVGGRDLGFGRWEKTFSATELWHESA